MAQESYKLLVVSSILTSAISGHSAVGSASALGAESRRFESYCSDVASMVGISFMGGCAELVKATDCKSVT